MRSPPPPQMTCGFLIQLVFCQKKTMWFIGVEVEQETSTPPPKKIPGSAPGGNCFGQKKIAAVKKNKVALATSWLKSVFRSSELNSKIIVNTFLTEFIEQTVSFTSCRTALKKHAIPRSLTWIAVNATRIAWIRYLSNVIFPLCSSVAWEDRT